MTALSSTVVSPVRPETVGATLFTCTANVAVFPVSPSESVAEALTVGSAGPSGKMHLKLPDVLVKLSLKATLLPPVPQLVVTLDTVSTPGSLIVYV